MPKNPLVEPTGKDVSARESTNLDLATAYVITCLMKQAAAETGVGFDEVVKLAINAKSAAICELFKKNIEPKNKEFIKLLESAKLLAAKHLGKYSKHIDTFKVVSKSTCSFKGKVKRVGCVTPVRAFKFIHDFKPEVSKTYTVEQQAKDLLKNVNLVFAGFKGAKKA